MATRVYITGTGIISSIGNNTAGVFESLTTSRSGIGPVSLLKTIHRESLPVAEIKLDYEALASVAGVNNPKYHTRTALLGIIAAREAASSAGIDDQAKREFRTGLISATSVGGMDSTEHFYEKFHRDNSKGRLSDIINHDGGESTERIAGAVGIHDFMSTISTACSSSANSIMFAARLIKNGYIDIAIAGGTDALTKFTLNGFNSLMILDKNGCRPFDENRNGLTLGEGAGYLVLESEKTANIRKRTPLCEIKGYGNACDAYHQTASSPEGKGARLAMQKALDVAGIQPSEISYVNVHGTGTVNNDLSEGMAMESIFSGKTPPFSSTKSFTGHTLGAAGGVEAVISILSIRHNMIFPNLNFTTGMKELSCRPVTQLIRNAGVRTVLSNSFGFGGNNSALIFSIV